MSHLANVEAEEIDAGFLVETVALRVDDHRQAFGGARWVAQATHLHPLLYLRCIHKRAVSVNSDLCPHPSKFNLLVIYSSNFKFQAWPGHEISVNAPAEQPLTARPDSMPGPLSGTRRSKSGLVC